MKFTELPNEIIFNILSFHSFDTIGGIKTLCSLQSITKEFNKNKLFDELFWKEIFENKFFNQNKFFSNNLNEIKQLKEKIKQNYKFYYSTINHYIYLKYKNTKKQFKKNHKPTTTNIEQHKIVVTGDGGNGKSATTVRFIQNMFVDEYDPTIEDSYRKFIDVDNIKCYVEVLDTAGPEEYSAMRNQYLRATDAIIYICSINDKSSLNSLENYFEQTARVKETNIYPCVLCVNKIDLPKSEHQITKEMVDEFLVNLIEKGYLLFECPIFFTSAKNGINIDGAFEEIVRLCRVDYSIDMFNLMKRVISDGRKVFKDFNDKKQVDSKCYLQ
ncbi:hypothetical protein ABK040_013972 [Willaertia magna]